MFSALRYAADLVLASGAYILASKRHRALPSLTPIDAISKLSPLVTRVLGQNAGPLTLQGTNTYLIGAGEERILIDAGEPHVDEYVTQLKLALGTARISAIIATHWHHDHVGGIPDVISKVIGGNVPVYKIRSERHDNNDGNFSFAVDGDLVKVPGATIRFVTTPGHTIDHASLWLEEEGALFSGDCILGQGTTVFEDLHAYMLSLERIRELSPKVIYPGHGPVVDDPAATIEDYVKHRLLRENQILEVLERAGARISSMDITKEVYSTAPLAVRVAALNNVKLHLDKLVKDGRVDKSPYEMYHLNP